MKFVKRMFRDDGRRPHNQLDFSAHHFREDECEPFLHRFGALDVINKKCRQRQEHDEDGEVTPFVAGEFHGASLSAVNWRCKILFARARSHERHVARKLMAFLLAVTFRGDKL